MKPGEEEDDSDAQQTRQRPLTRQGKFHDKICAELFRFPRENAEALATFLLYNLELDGEIRSDRGLEARQALRLKRFQKRVVKYREQLSGFLETYSTENKFLKESPMRSKNRELPLPRLQQQAKDVELAIGISIEALVNLESKIAEATRRGARRPRSRPKTETYVHWVTTLALVYSRCLGEKPTSTIGSHFYNLVSIARSHQLGREARDVSRLVRAAIRSAFDGLEDGCWIKDDDFESDAPEDNAPIR